jgi:hypothetical protein
VVARRERPDRPDVGTRVNTAGQAFGSANTGLPVLGASGLPPIKKVAIDSGSTNQGAYLASNGNLYNSVGLLISKNVADMDVTIGASGQRIISYVTTVPAC